LGLGQFLQNAHFGPIILSDAYDPGRWGDMGGVVWPEMVWQIIAVLSILSFAVLMAAIAASIGEWWNRRETALYDWLKLGLLLSALATAMLLIALLATRFDRYWMALFAPIFGWIALELGGQSMYRTPRSCWIASAILLVAVGCLSIAFTHDYLAWNQAKWRLVNAWLDEGFAPEKIDGGYEVNGWFRSAEDPQTRNREGDPTRWWSGRAERFIAVGPREGFTEITHRSWHSWATGREHFLLGLRRS
jgi:hypothetical protein